MCSKTEYSVIFVVSVRKSVTAVTETKMMQFGYNRQQLCCCSVVQTGHWEVSGK